MSTELSVETDYRNISRTHTMNPRARCSLYDPTVEYTRVVTQFSSDTVQLAPVSWQLESDSSRVSASEQRRDQDRSKRRTSECYNCCVVQLCVVPSNKPSSSKQRPL
jgi:hypothetical protein